MEFLGTWGGRVLGLLVFLLLGWFLMQKRVARYRQRQFQQDFFARVMIASQEKERKRIAAELHDGLGQNLLLIKNRAILVLEGPRSNLDIPFQLREISRVASQSIAEIREIARNLRPYQLDRLGLTKALQAAVRDASHACPIHWTHDIESVDDLFSPEIEINLYRIVQEGLNNVLKHSAAQNAKVTFRRQDDGYRLLIHDDGCGFEMESQSAHFVPEDGWGLTGMRERARIIQGRLEINSRPGSGTRITLRLPWKETQQSSRPSVF